jgi:hypothetical protein
MELCAANVPQLDVDTFRTALAEEEHGHQPSLAVERTKGKTSRDRRVLAFYGSMTKIAEATDAPMTLGRSHNRLAAVALVAAAAGAQYWLYSERSEHWVDLATPRGSLRVLKANDASDRSRGLARRDDVPGDGLLLEWDTPGRHPIWMKDMRFSLI